MPGVDESGEVGECGAVVLWCCGAVVLWCCGAVVLWCCGAVVLWANAVLVDLGVLSGK